MAADKKRYIRNAQKQVQKGQLDRAIASYKAILKMDQNDEKIHNALGDLYIRRNMKNEGIQEYLWVADFYEKDGFHLRSIAICQKILNLDADLAGVRRKLADLYSQQRLPAEAKKQYLQVADYFDRKGKIAEALEVFGKIADLDPDNLKVRVRLGAMFEKQSLPSKAAGEYTRAAEGHLKKKELDKAAELLGKALELNPENSAARRAMAELHAGREEWSEVVQALEPLMADDAADAQVLKTYAAACLKTAKPAEAVKALEMAREKEPSSLPVKTLLGRAYLQGEEFDKALEIYSPIISDYLKDNKVEAAEDLSRQLADAGPENDKALQRHLEVLQRKGDTDEIPGIYLKLADIYQARELPRNAVGVLEKYLELNPGDQEVTARVEALRTGGAAPVAAPPPEVAPAPEVAPPPEVAQAPEVAPAPPAPSLEEEIEVEMIDLEGEELADLAAGEEEAAAPSPPAPGLEGEKIHVDSLEEEEEILLDVEEELEMTGAGETAAAEAAAAPAGPAVEEADADEAFLAVGQQEVVEEVVLEAEPEPEPVEESAPLTEVEPDKIEEPAAAAAPDVAEEGLDLDFESLQEAEEVPASVMAGDSVTVDSGSGEEIEEFLAEADFYFQQGLLDEAEFLYSKLSKLDPLNEEIIDRLRRFEEQKKAAPLLSDDGISALESDLDRILSDAAKPDRGLKITVSGDEGERQPGEFSEFLSDLREELDEDVPLAEPVATDEEGLSEIFQEFREGLKEQLGEEDFETHYNLGIAYKEMGLMQEALGEFELSEKSEVRKLDSISMIALCLRDMGRDEDAVVKLQEGLERSPQGSEAQKGFLYDLADLYSKVGHEGESVEMFNRLYALDPGYRDVGKRAHMVQGHAEASPAAKKSGAKPARSKKSRISYL